MSEESVIANETRNKPVEEIGNEHSTLKNPYDIMTESSYNVYVYFANYCKVTSGR